MQPQSHAFKAKAKQGLADRHLQSAMARVEKNFVGHRRAAVAGLPEFDQLRSEARAIKDHVIAHLDFYLEAFERQVVTQGGQVHWCRSPREARETILALARAAGARTATKGKSMIAEEIALNPFLEKNGVAPIETDLGEYILQLAGEPPSHIIGPAVHKTRDQISDLFHSHHSALGLTQRLTEPEAMVAEARGVLRQKFLDADIGITGANFLVAETGSAVIVTNEGNGDLTQILPRLHIVLASIEKIVPTLEDACTLLRVLARSATGQEASVYTTFATGPKRLVDVDGPDEFHVVLLDNGRSALIGTEAQALLRCIRCGACMNHCPVYQAVGGHAYGWVYPGPIGAALNPMMLGIEETRDLPAASTFCGRCEEVCPMQIPLPGILRYWRTRAYAAGIEPSLQRAALKLWGFVARRAWAYRPLARAIMFVLNVFGRKRGRFSSLPLAGGWTAARDLPAPQGPTFIDQWRRRRP
jgi:L-lactate dehydrogenase complex protein LldF